MNINKKLEKLRKASIKGPTPIYVHSYNKGFNAACELLLPEIEKMREALVKISNEQFFDDDEKEAWFTAREALKQWQEFAEGE